MQVFDLINAVFVKNPSHRDVPLNLIVWRYMVSNISMHTRKDEQKSTSVKNAVIPQMNQKFTISTWKTNILIVLHCSNFMIKGTLNLLIRTLLICSCKYVHNDFYMLKLVVENADFLVTFSFKLCITDSSISFEILVRTQISILKSTPNEHWVCKLQPIYSSFRLM